MIVTPAGRPVPEPVRHNARMSSSDTRTRESAARESPAGAVRDLLRWYQPYLAGQHARIAWVVVGTAVVLACQAVIPWVVETILAGSEEEALHSTEPIGWPTGLIGLLLTLVVTQLLIGYVARVGAHAIATDSASTLIRTLFARLLRGRLLRQQGLRRSSVVMRMTADVDRVTEAIASTIAEGLPGVARLLVALTLLTVLEWRAGIAMIAATIVFVLLRRAIGRRLLVADRERIQALSAVSDGVDETISTARALGGLRLLGWQSTRFARIVDELDHRTHRQGVLVVRLDLAANATGLIGLVVVVLLGLAVGGPAIASIAAALLYVENAVRGMEALPPWIRAVQLASASRHRIDDILDDPDRVAVPVAGGSRVAVPAIDGSGADGSGADGSADHPGLVLDDLRSPLLTGHGGTGTALAVPVGAVVGLVVAPGRDPDDVLAVLAGDEDPDSGRVLLDGVDVRTPSSGDRIAYVPHAVTCPTASPLDLLAAVDPTMDEARAVTALAAVGLEHVAALPAGVGELLGPGAVELTANEEQRLMLAVALAARPTALLIGPLLGFADVDSALSLLATVRATGRPTTVVAAATVDVAEAVDVVLYVGEDQVRVAAHQDLLVTDERYAQMWEQRLARGEVDLSVIGIDDGDVDRMLARLVTEHFAPGELVYRQGAPADRIMFIVSGHVEVTIRDGDGAVRRVAVLGPGNHCGDLRLTVGERRAESAAALDDCVVRSLSRQAIHAGMTGLLDRTPAERRVVEAILRNGPASRAELRRRLGEMDPAAVETAVALLLADGALRDDEGRLTAVLRRGSRSGAADLLDRLGDL